MAVRLNCGFRELMAVWLVRRSPQSCSALSRARRAPTNDHAVNRIRETTWSENRRICYSVSVLIFQLPAPIQASVVARRNRC